MRGKLTSWDEIRRVRTVPDNAHAGALWLCARDGDFAGYLRILGGLAAGGAPKSDISIGLTRSPRKTCYGDMSHSITGIRILCGIDLLFSAITRTPGRFELVEADPGELESEPCEDNFEIGIEVYTVGAPPL